MGPRSSLLATLAAALDRVAETVGRAVAWLTLAMVLVTFTVVVLRYAFDMGWIALQESITWLHALVFLLGAAYTLRHDGHVRVDILYQRWSPRTQAWVDLAGTLVFLFPVCAFILWSSWDYVAAAWRLREGSGETGGLPGVFLLKSAIPAMAVLLMIQGLARAARCLATLTGGEPGARAPDGASREL